MTPDHVDAAVASLARLGVRAEPLRESPWRCGVEVGGVRFWTERETLESDAEREDWTAVIAALARGVKV